MFSSLMIDLAELEKERKVDEVKLFGLVLRVKRHHHVLSLTIDLFVSFKLLCIEMLPPSSSVVPTGGRGVGEASPAAGLAVPAVHARQDGRGTEVPTEVSSSRTPEPNCGRVFVRCQVLTSIRAVQGQANDGLSSALLIVFLDSAKNLPVSLLLLPSMHLHARSYARVVMRKILTRPEKH